MKLGKLLDRLEPGTVVCITHGDMKEDWYKRPTLVTEIDKNTKVREIGPIHPDSNEFPGDDPAIRIYIID